MILSICLIFWAGIFWIYLVLLQSLFFFQILGQYLRFLSKLKDLAGPPKETQNLSMVPVAPSSTASKKTKKEESKEPKGRKIAWECLGSFVLFGNVWERLRKSGNVLDCFGMFGYVWKCYEMLGLFGQLLGKHGQTKELFLLQNTASGYQMIPVVSR